MYNYLEPYYTVIILYINVEYVKKSISKFLRGESAEDTY